jgi:hypothetical protein
MFLDPAQQKAARRPLKQLSFHLRCRLEHFQKNCSHLVGKSDEAVLLGFGFVSAQSQGCFEPAPSPKADDRHHSPKLKNPRSGASRTGMELVTEQ